MLQKRDVKSQILDMLRKGDGIPIYRIAQGCNISIATASKYCCVLEAENKVKITKFGNMKLVNKK
jgi:predicted transcriptional regulator